MFDSNKATQVRDDVKLLMVGFFRENITNPATVRDLVYDVINALDRLAALGPDKGNEAVVVANGIERAWETFAEEFSKPRLPSL